MAMGMRSMLTKAVATIRHNCAASIGHIDQDTPGTQTTSRENVMAERFRFIPPLVGKALVIGFLIVLLLVPLAQVESLVGERVEMRQTAAMRVAESWGGAQTTAGVLLAIPVETTRVVVDQTAAGRETQRTEVERNVLYVLPDTLKISASVDPDYRTVGLYETPVYTAHVQISGEFVNRDFAQLLPERQGREVKWSEARLLVLNSESRALRAVDDLEVAGERLQVSADGYAGSAGISTSVPVAALRESASIPFRLKLTLAGSSQLNFLPLARKAEIAIKSALAASEVRGRAGAARSADHATRGSAPAGRCSRSTGTSDRAGTTAQVRPGEPAEVAFAQSGVGVDVLRAGRHLSAQLPRGALRGAAHRRSPS